MVYLEQEMPSFFPLQFAECKKPRKITTNKLLTRTKFQRFLNKALLFSFKKLVVSTQSLLQGLHTISLAKSVPKGLKPQECERTKLREPPPVPYVPNKDEVQEEVAKLRNLRIKTSLKKDTTLNFLVWHDNGTQEAFLMHLTAVLDAIKKHGTFKDYEKAKKAYVEAKKAAESAEAGLTLLNGTSPGASRIARRKPWQRPKKLPEKPLQRPQKPSKKPRKLKKRPM
jgi:hypothetical protein